jgi:hypothetical protein
MAAMPGLGSLTLKIRKCTNSSVDVMKPEWAVVMMPLIYSDLLSFAIAALKKKSSLSLMDKDETKSPRCCMSL